MRGDPTSFSNCNDVKSKQLNINWNVNFSRKILEGFVDITFEVLQDSVANVILDTKDLKINGISMNGTTCTYELKGKTEKFGSPLHVALPSITKKGDNITLHIEYETSNQASALQWLTPEQTAGKKHPYMFSQCQAIHARSILPCQDTPSVKAPYKATVTVQDPLVVLMSALQCFDRRAKNKKGEFYMTYTFEQKVPMPSYLIAIAAGLLKSKDIGPRSKVWSEESMVEKSAEEFADTEKMLAAAEEIAGPYVWEQYDLLVLPPSFPYGGMENPCLTFVTPTLLTAESLRYLVRAAIPRKEFAISKAGNAVRTNQRKDSAQKKAGDRSLANVIAHEISHSWTGNLVTNHTWEDFWLNEGHTVFLERKIISKLYNEETRHFQALNGLQALKYSIDVFGKDNPFTNLVVKLDGVDPDDAFSSVPYEKGHSLLFYLETLLGGPTFFDPFLRSYIDKFKYQSVTTPQWKAYLYEYFADKKAILDTVDWDAWFNTPGMPPVIPQYDQTLSKECTQLADRWAKAQEDDLKSFHSTDVKTFSAWQKIEFLGQLLQKDPFPPSHIARMNEKYKLSSIENSEIKFRWLRLNIRAKCPDCVEHALKMSTDQGRMKFTRPLFRDLGAWDESRQAAIDHFKKHRPFMHSTTAQLVEKDLKL